MSLTAGAGTRCMSLLSSSSNLFHNLPDFPTVPPPFSGFRASFLIFKVGIGKKWKAGTGKGIWRLEMERKR